MMDTKTEIAETLREVATAAEERWVKLYLETVESTTSYYERDRVYAMLLSAREAYRAARRGGDILGDMRMSVMNQKASWVLHPTPEKEGRFEGLQNILDAVDAKLYGGAR